MSRNSRIQGLDLYEGAMFLSLPLLKGRHFSEELLCGGQWLREMDTCGWEPVDTPASTVVSLLLGKKQSPEYGAKHEAYPDCVSDSQPVSLAVMCHLPTQPLGR